MDLKDKVVLITGGTGSFGRALARTLLGQHALRKLIIFSRDEAKQHQMLHDPVHQSDRRLRFFIGDVRDGDRLEMAFRDVDYVVHAAALKHISIAEYNPFECIRTNVHGAENVVTAAIRMGVKKVIALSTDKAASPINLYGASKLASDKIFVAAKNLVGSGAPYFAVVRYGNVIGSRGSVIPLFQQRLREKASTLPITDERMTRFWITLEHGVEFVLSCLTMMRGGEIFVPKIPSMRITDVADAIAPNTPREPIGIRSGEKLHEVMITEDDARSTVELSDRFVIRPPYHEREHYDSGQKQVAEGFRYASDTNTEWLSADDMRALIDGHDFE
jgi:UDP-N-acetylglucosamine 4,6-dehydratase